MKTGLFLLLINVLAFSTASDAEVEIIRLNEQVWVYRSFIHHNGNIISANGLILKSGGEVVLIDTPWDKRQTIQLLDWIENNLDATVSFAIITHAHLDRIGGIEIMKSREIPTVGSTLTTSEALKNGFSKPDISFRSDTLLKYGSSSVEAFFPGAGHTPDNTVVYLKNHHILYGGCFIKSSSSTSLGNLEDANIKEWPHSLRRTIDRYPNSKLVIPGHGNWEKGAIENTLQLLSGEK